MKMKDYNGFIYSNMILMALNVRFREKKNCSEHFSHSRSTDGCVI